MKLCIYQFATVAGKTTSLLLRLVALLAKVTDLAADGALLLRVRALGLEVRRAAAAVALGRLGALAPHVIEATAVEARVLLGGLGSFHVGLLAWSVENCLGHRDRSFEILLTCWVLAQRCPPTNQTKKRQTHQSMVGGRNIPP